MSKWYFWLLLCVQTDPHSFHLRAHLPFPAVSESLSTRIAAPLLPNLATGISSPLWNLNTGTTSNLWRLKEPWDGKAGRNSRITQRRWKKRTPISVEMCVHSAWHPAQIIWHGHSFHPVELCHSRAADLADSDNPQNMLWFCWQTVVPGMPIWKNTVASSGQVANLMYCQLIVSWKLMERWGCGVWNYSPV